MVWIEDEETFFLKFFFYKNFFLISHVFFAFYDIMGGGG